MIRLMLYACDYEIEGLVATASGTPGGASAQEVPGHGR